MTPSRSRGRPTTQQPSSRGLILDALARLLGADPLSRPSLRQVAGTAGVSPALLHYYFREPSDLMRSLLEERALPLLQPALQELQAAGADPGAGIARFLHRWSAAALRNPWLPACLTQVPADAPAAIRDFGAALRSTVVAAQRQGTLRRDLPDGYLALLLLSLGMLPHLSRTALAGGIDPAGMSGPEDAAALTLQHLAVLRSGIAPPQSPRQDSTS